MTTFLFLWSFFFKPSLRNNGEKYNEKTNTGEGVKHKRGRTTSDDVRGNANSQTVSTDRMGNRDETLDDHYTHMFCEKSGVITTEDEIPRKS